MNYQKVDAGLAAALTEDEDGVIQTLDVFIHAESKLTAEQAAALRQAGAPAKPGDLIVIARLSPRQVQSITDCPWVRNLRLSSRSRLLE